MTAELTTVAAPVPAPSEQDLHPEQLVRGVLKNYKAYARSEKAYRLCNEVIQLKRQMPIMLVPLGDGDQLEFDLNHLVKDIKEPDGRREIIQHVLGHWNNYFVRRYGEDLRALALVSRNAYVTLSGQDLADEEASSDFEALTAHIHGTHTQLEPRAEVWLSIVSGETSADLMLSVPGVEEKISLSALLAMGGVVSQEISQQVQQTLIDWSSGTAKENLVSCLRTMARTTAKAVTVMDQLASQ